MTNLYRLIQRRTELLANLEDMAPFRDSQFPHERQLWKDAAYAYGRAEADYRKAVAKAEVIHEH